MADQPILNRLQLSQFLNNHEAIKAFEALFKYVSQTAPEQTDDISAVIASIKTPNAELSNLQLRLDNMEQEQKRLRNIYADIKTRLENIEMLIGVN